MMRSFPGRLSRTTVTDNTPASLKYGESYLLVCFETFPIFLWSFLAYD